MICVQFRGGGIVAVRGRRDCATFLGAMAVWCESHAEDGGLYARFWKDN